MLVFSLELGVSAFIVVVLPVCDFEDEPSSWEDEELICELITRHRTFRIPDCYTRSARPLNLPLTLSLHSALRERWCQYLGTLHSSFSGAFTDI